jgi:iron complex transport system substrate-binding protein
MRVVSLLPSATEIICAVGAADQLVAISHECDFPSGVADRPVATRSRIAVGGSSAEIDRAVKAALIDALSIYAVDSDLLARLAPDVIVTQDLCEVCAVSLDDVRSAIARYAHDRVELVSLRPTRLADVLDDVVRVASALDRRAAGEALRSAMQVRIAAIAARVRSGAPRPRVATLEWLDPVMLGGTWMPDLVELAGGRAVGVAAGAPAPTLALAELAELAAEIVLIKPCGFALDRTLGERALIDRILAGLDPKARVFATDGSAYFNRPGPRLVESLEIMAACVDPIEFAEFAERHAGALVQLQ